MVTAPLVLFAVKSDSKYTLLKPCPFQVFTKNVSKPGCPPLSSNAAWFKTKSALLLVGWLKGFA